MVGLVVKALEATAKTRFRQKTRLYARILIGAVVNSASIEFRPEDYPSILSELASREIEVARVIYGQ